MLSHLHVKNLALISEAEIDFTKGLNILTGETGAGKSIVIGSVGLALGDRVSSDMIRQGANYGLAELVFTVEKELQIKKLEAVEVVPDDGQVIITRKLMDGKSVSKINGETVTLTRLREVASILLDVHGQHEHQSLLHKKNHLEILDKFAGEKLISLKKEMSISYHKYQELKKKLNEKELDESGREREIALLTFEIEEIEKADLKEDEDENLESHYKKMQQSFQVMDTLTKVHEMTSYEELDSTGERLGKALRDMQSVATYDEEVESFVNQLSDIDALLNDFNRELSNYIEDQNFDEKDFQEAEERLNQINHLKVKYGKSIEKIHAYKAQQEARLEELENYEKFLSDLQQELEETLKKLETIGKEITRIRSIFATQLEKEIKIHLMDLNFLDVEFEVGLRELENFTAKGKDEVEFLISMNPGEEKKPLGKVASGGELSRIMLAIKTVLADKDEIETVIFDEIDVGISGRTAQKVSEKMAVIGKTRQVICITHLAQIAAMADSHYYINKYIQNQETTTTVNKLTEEESIEELARILGGAEITNRVVENAREMKALAKTKK